MIQLHRNDVNQISCAGLKRHHPLARVAVVVDAETREGAEVAVLADVAVALPGLQCRLPGQKCLLIKMVDSFLYIVCHSCHFAQLPFCTVVLM